MALGTPDNKVDGGAENVSGVFTPSGYDFITDNSTPSPSFKLDPTKYKTIGELVGEYAKPDVRENLVKTYGDQGITGFLKLTGAISAAAVQDEVTYFEEGRRHKILTSTNTAITVAAATHVDLDFGQGDNPQVYDILMDVTTGQKYYVSNVADGEGNDGSGSAIADITTLDGGTTTWARTKASYCSATCTHKAPIS